MNKLSLDIDKPHWETLEDFKRRYTYPQISILIDGENIFNDKTFDHNGRQRYSPVGPGSFLYENEPYISENETDKLDGLLLIGVCSACFNENCDDLYINITFNKNIIKWELSPDGIRDYKREFTFDFDEYVKEIDKLKKYYFSYEWEDNNARIRRICNEYIKNFKSSEGKNILGLHIPSILDDDDNETDKLENKLEIYKYNLSIIEVEWNGETLESALKNLKEYAENNLIFPIPNETTIKAMEDEKLFSAASPEEMITDALKDENE